MKKIAYLLTFVSLSPLFKAQTTDPAPATTQPPAPYTDSRSVRFGLRITPQPTWLSSDDKNNLPSGAKFGFGFGLNLEFRFSEVTALLTGIGGDMEGGKYKFRNDGTYNPSYFLDESNLMLKPGKGEQRTAGNTLYSLKERNFSNSYVTIPLILKLSTHEHYGLRYFGMFGGEFGIRIKAKATDSYNSATTFDTTGVATVGSGPGTLDININKDSSPVPLRVGLNVGIGGEYRFAETTSLFFSINYMRSFINAYRSTSDYIFYQAANTANNTQSYKYIQQSIVLNALRINIGIMF